MNDDMVIAIPTAGRVESQPTLEAFHAAGEWGLRTRLVCPAGEWDEYADRWGEDVVVPSPPHVTGIAPTRQWITTVFAAEMGTSFVCQASDDMRFAKRKEPGSSVLVPAGPADVDDMLRELECMLQEGLVHVGVSARSGNNRVTSPRKHVARMNDLYAHNVEHLALNGIRWDRLPVMEDFDVTLQLLRNGNANAVVYEYCWDQAATNQPGGCSAYRTPAVQEAGARGLAQLHPGFVRVREAPAKNWKGFPGTRWDVTCYWQKAYDSAVMGDDDRV